MIQLRQDNALGTLYNLVGFQTKMKYAEQTRVFRMIPGLENAEFARLGGLHRNTFINSPRLLDEQLRLKARPNIRFAGQITGVEGYVESAAIGLLAGRFAAAEYLDGATTCDKPFSPHGGEKGWDEGGDDVDEFRGPPHPDPLPPVGGEGNPSLILPPRTTALGALLAHITGSADAETFQPMNVNFGLFPPIVMSKGKDGGRNRKLAYTERAKKDLGQWLTQSPSTLRQTGT